jgi:hypothetical protein
MSFVDVVMPGRMNGNEPLEAALALRPGRDWTAIQSASGTLRRRP